MQIAHFRGIAVDSDAASNRNVMGIFFLNLEDPVFFTS